MKYKREILTRRVKNKVEQKVDDNWDTVAVNYRAKRSKINLFLLGRLRNAIGKDTVTEEPISPEARLAIACIDLLAIPGSEIVFVQRMLVRGEGSSFWQIGESVFL